MKMTAYWSTLLYYARQEAKARADGDMEALARAEAKHQSYRELCLRPDVNLVVDTDGGV